MSNIDKIEELTKSLVEFPSKLENGLGPPTRYKVDEGDVLSWYLYEDEGEVGVHRWFMTKGTEFPEHIHEEKEWVVVYKGEIELTRGNGTKDVIVAGEMAFNKPNHRHSATFLQDTYCITIMIPASKEYPHVTNRR